MHQRRHDEAAGSAPYRPHTLARALREKKLRVCSLEDQRSPCGRPRPVPIAAE